MKWPLFVTLTVANVTDPGVPFIRQLRRDFGKLRHRKIWKDNVAGGVAAIEVTRLKTSERRARKLAHEEDTGWHPHLHALIDCEWLAIKTPKPQWGSSRALWAVRCKAAQREFAELWAKTTKQPTAVVWIQRTKGEQCAREVLKYAIKGSDLSTAPGRIGPLIHQLRATRLTTSFGTLFGKHLIRDDASKPPLLCDACGNKPEWIPEMIVEALVRKRSK